jgi:hypothetical protein
VNNGSLEEELQARLRELAREVRRLRQELDEIRDRPAPANREPSSFEAWKPPPRRRSDC